MLCFCFVDTWQYRPWFCSTWSGLERFGLVHHMLIQDNLIYISLKCKGKNLVLHLSKYVMWFEVSRGTKIMYINHLQDIFECRTCGLTGSLCCCTECAKVCHKGHDCKLKRTSPTAYCDCWEKCKCKALIMGQQAARYNLLCRLVTETDLVSQPNSR